MTPYEAQQRKNRIRDLELYGWQFVCSLSDEQFGLACNGCGPASWPEEKRRKLTKWLVTFLPAFDTHDCDFTFNNDGSRELFDAANHRLKKNCILIADEKYAWWNPPRYLARRAGKIIAAACQEFGWSDWKKAYNKNQERKQQMKDNEPITKAERVCAGLAVLWMLCGATLAGLLVGGCKSIEVEYRGKGLATWTDTNGVVRAICDDLGKPIFFDKGWVVDYFQHGTFTKMDEMHAEAGVAKLDLNGYQSGMDSNLVALVDVSLKGTAELAAKIGTAIATCGGSAAAEGGASGIISLAKQAYSRFIKRGGNESKAVVSSAADGTVTVSDGSIGVQCANGVCSDCADGACKD